MAQETEAGWRLLSVESSYGHFRERAAGLTPQGPPRGEAPDVPALLEACRRLAGQAPDMVAVDMPMARTPILGRKAGDLEIARAYRWAKLATHAPSALRPGPIADSMREDFERAGFALCTEAATTPGVMSVYPHTALLALTGDPVRLPYKAGKTTRYWPGLSLAERAARVREVWRRIVAALEKEIAGVAQTLPPPGPEVRGRSLKAYEDRLDAAICAYVAIAALDGRARAFGDADSAIWAPAIVGRKSQSNNSA